MVKNKQLTLQTRIYRKKRVNGSENSKDIKIITKLGMTLFLA
jgi:hypothetical protein